MHFSNHFEVYFNESMALSHASFYAMNTVMDIVLCNVQKLQAEELISKIYNHTIKAELLLNRFDPQSEVYKLNHSNDFNVIVSNELFEIIELCKRYNELSLHFFDICVNSKPDFSPGMKDVVLIQSQKSIKYKRGIQFDFGGFAKGYVLDNIYLILKEASVNNALVNFGNSSILAMGHHPHGDFWKVGIQHLYNPGTAVYTFDLKNESLTSSGMLPNKMPHIKSPLNGELCTENATYSIVCKSAAMGEALSTALYASNNYELQKQILKNFNIENAIKIEYKDSLFETLII